jgi:osmotically-inducible protein OsmY
MAKLTEELAHFRADREIRDDVIEELRFDPTVTDPDAVTVSVRDGVVTLGGSADSLAQRWAVQRAARRVRSVQRLVDEITVMFPKPEERDDCDIEDTANRVLQWDARVPNGVVARVHDGWLTLRGAVDFSVERTAAFDAVRNIIGLHGISNEIEIAPSTVAPDLEATLLAALRRRIDGEDVEVAVDVGSGTVTLSGTVPSYAEREEIEQTVAMAPGVRNVDDRIRVSS